MRAYGKTLAAYREDPLVFGDGRLRQMRFRRDRKRARVEARREIASELEIYLVETRAEMLAEIAAEKRYVRDNELWRDYLQSEADSLLDLWLYEDELDERRADELPDDPLPTSTYRDRGDYDWSLDYEH